MKGILNINKPQNYTSHDCVAIVRRLVSVKRVGHTGTLDPMATGVLPICIGTTTRIIEYLDDDKKEYLCTAKLGISTDTCDIWGKVLEEKDSSSISEEEIRSCLMAMEGPILQVPPMYAAIKVNGKKLYQYAREGKTLEVEPRPVTLHKIQILSIEGPEVTFKVLCSKGTYVRSICRDLGDKLGTGGTMTSLCRTANGIFKIEDAIDIEQLKTMDKEQISKLVKGPDYPLDNFKKIFLNRNQAKDFIDGKHIVVDESMGITESDKEREAMFTIYLENMFIGTARYNRLFKKLVAHKVLNTEIGR